MEDDENDYPHLPQNLVGISTVILGGILSWGAAIAFIVYVISHW